MTFLQSISKISELNGHFTESVLLGRGFNKGAISSALSHGLLERRGGGVLTSTNRIHRHSHLTEVVAAAIQPGSSVGVLDPKTHQMVPRQVVSVNGQNVLVLDPANPAAPVEVSINDIVMDSDDKKDVENRPDSAPEVSSPSTQQSPAPAPSTFSSSSPTV